jgi:uncharacterized protein YdiU (UPF0061 family)
MLRLKNSFSNLSKEFYQSIENFKQLENPELLILNNELLKKLSIDSFNFPVSEMAHYLSGSKPMPGSTPLAMCYAGHQFGQFVPRLGDGRAMLLGEILSPVNIRYDIHLKGSGVTIYSRRGDGKCAIGPAIREYLISEYLNAVNIPTTRTLSIVLTGEKVLRETVLPGAVLARVAKSHIRIGTFEYFAALGDKKNLEILFNYSIDRLFPELNPLDHEQKAFEFWKKVGELNISLVLDWMSVGFIHGVMNTDNTNISGESLDFGPCAFMDHFQFSKVFSSIDVYGRYAYSNQPSIILWNLERLAEALSLVTNNQNEKFVEQLTFWKNSFPVLFKNRMAQKLGLGSSSDKLKLHNDELLIVDEWFNLMQKHQWDFTQAFLDLERYLEGKALYQINIRDQEQKDFLQKWEKRITNKNEALGILQKTNPSIIPRNHMVEKVIQDANENKFEKFFELVKILKDPFLRRDDLLPIDLPPKPNEVVHKTFCGT